ncbi:alpha/beta-hydrolase family protein [Sinorhizobium sp. BG8]|uniref:alpha/beta hydrolase n=1 Tax=Sinorhizobium sp. BG8 TaxID=2613773 RepID=UPI00193D9A88|nr:alpha/beta-hydrolase family protein [Sinorhizobium sp. BG8]QRM56212.1 hypothetical protein F3Y30_17960 [Sinorhizobium sp. BG8]
MQLWLARFWFSFSSIGLLLGTLFFAASLTPSLLPRTYVTQGVLSGVSLAIGYGLGVLFYAIWVYLELPVPRSRVARLIKLLASAACAIVVAVFLWRTAEWQNSIRSLMHLEPVETGHPFKVGLIALVAFLVLIALARLFRFVLFASSRISQRFAPTRLSYVIGGVLAVVLFWSAVEGVLFRFALHAADSSLRALDELIEPDTPRPTDPARTGSEASLVTWEDLGRRGREFVANAPTKDQLSAFLGGEALEPIRVYVGLNGAASAEDRAKLALQELIRVGGFQRSTLIVIMPTGTGWVDPEGIGPVEYLTRGDVASVAIQYSYLSSWLSLLVEPDYGAQAAQALFREVYGYWTSLPKDARPKLYLHGLSLGALSSEQSAELFEVIGDPYQGAFWAGPPFPSRIWRSMTNMRDPASPAWLPRVKDGSFVRFTSQRNALSEANAPWGAMRIVYLQYASDPITFFSYQSLYRRPEWMVAPIGPDVSPQFKWYPVVTFLQLGLDLAMSTTSPMGFGHVFAGEHYIDGWVAVLGIEGWSAENIARLKNKFRADR